MPFSKLLFNLKWLAQDSHLKLVIVSYLWGLYRL